MSETNAMGLGQDLACFRPCVGRSRIKRVIELRLFKTAGVFVGANLYKALETTEERLDGRYVDIYFTMDLNISALTSKVEAIQGEFVEIQSYIVRRPEASISVDRRNNKSIDTHNSTTIDSDIN
ncbi:hypothetical protein F2Q68_00004924 [Brassica cretica]|uniref:Uncharacterized protein n=1 Tax=Brassica cretica TaxID=69181 RepID=A0A8S9J6B6_BRACR|nr:hypothetical protein F2Q68_00004924 [Brassica cretica]